MRRSTVVITCAPERGSLCWIRRTGRPIASTSIRSPPSWPRRYSSSSRSRPLWPTISPRRYRPCLSWSSLASRTYPSRCAAKRPVGYTRCGSTSVITPGTSSFHSSTFATSCSVRPRRTRTGRNESVSTRATATAIARMRCCTASRRPGMRRRPKTRLTRRGSGRAGAQGLDACEGHHERGAQEAVVERLREDDVEHHVAEGRREVEDLQQREPGEALGHREEHEPGHLDERLGHREPAPRGPHGEADDGLRERLHPDQSAPRRVLEEPRGEARHAPKLGALTERQEHDHDEGKVGGHAVDAERRGERRMGDAPAEHGEREQRTHQPPVGKCAARSCRVSPVTSSTSSTRAKSTAGSSAA